METHIITGRVAREPRAGQTKNNKDYTSFTVSSEKKYQDKTFTSYHGFMAYGEEAKVAARLGVNDIVQVMSNEAQATTYEKKDTGEVKAALNYTVRQIEVLSVHAASESTSTAPQRSSPPTSRPAQSRPAAPARTESQAAPDEDVPF
jgi:single-stranded DNA-binding protein